MRFDRIISQGVGSDVNFDLDLSSIPGPLIAVVGKNGSGKSTLLEMLAGALDRTCPTRGTLVSLAKRRDSSLELHCTNGKSWRIKHDIDAISGKSESEVIGPDGSHALPDRKVRSFDAWRALAIPPKEVLFSSTFLPQGSRGFIKLSPAERKAVILRIKGCEQLEELSKMARENAREAKGKLDTVTARIADALVLLPSDVGTWLPGSGTILETLLERARHLVAEATRRHIAAQEAARTRAEDVQQARSDLEVITRENARRSHAKAARDALDARLRDATTKRDALQTRRALCLVCISEQPNVQKATDRIREIESILAPMRDELSQKRSDLASFDARLAEASQERDRILADLRGANGRQHRASQAVEAYQVASKAAEDLPRLEADVKDLEAKIEAARDRLKHKNGVALLDAEGRAQKLRGALTFYAEDLNLIEDHGDRARQALSADDAAIKARKERPAEIASLEREIAQLTAASKDPVAALFAARQAATRAEALAGAAAEVVSATEAIGELQRRHDDLVNGPRWPKDGDRTRLLDAVQDILDRGQAFASERAAFERVTARQSEIDRALATMAEIDRQIETAESDATRARAERAELGDESVDLLPVPDVLSLEHAKVFADKQLADAALDLTLRQKELEADKKTAARIRDLESERLSLEEELSDWTRLGNDLGKDGLQAMECDAAAPQLTEYANMLLHRCFGSRWTVSIESQREGTDGRAIEGFEVRVVDNERGRDAPVESLSGGEQTIVCEAISLALSMLSCTHWGMDRPTIIRDESAAALDAGNALSYVAMLRLAASSIGADRVFFVSHSEAVQQLADCRIHMTAGSPVVESFS